MKIAGIAAMALCLAVGHATAADANHGKAVFEQHCRNCHGANGAGNPRIAKMMHTQIPDLRSTEVQKMSDEQLKRTISDGKGKMPPIRDVTGKSLDDVVAYIRTLKK